MATPSPQTETRTQLMALINRWGARWRLRRVVLYLPRIVIASALVGIVVSLVIASSRLFALTGMLVVTATAISMTFVVIASALGLWSKRGYEAARQFEKLFGLQERITTALEILDGRIVTSPEIAQYQLEDAYEVARTVDPRKRIPLKVKWLEWVGALVTIMLLVLSLALAAFLTSQRASGISTQTQTAIGGAADTTRDIIEDLATDSNLTEEERSALLESAEATLNELENPDLSAEESFVAMSELESSLREQVEALRDEVSEANNALESAAEALNNQAEQPAENPGESLAEQLQEATENFEQLSQEERDQLAQELEQAADQIREQNPDLADALQQAAQAAQQNNSQDFNSSMNEASSQSQASSNQNEARAQSAETLEQAANQAQEAASEISESEQQSGEQPQQGSPPSDESGPQSGDGEQQGQGDNPNSNQASENGAQVQSDDPNAQPSDQNSGEDGTDSESLSLNQSAQGEESGAGGGAGDNSGGADEQGVSQIGQLQQIGDTANDGGESEFDSVFAPDVESIQTGDTTIELETDASNEQVREGDFQENPTGESTVPYNQVFRSYSQAAGAALENGYVPLGVRDVVRDYFTSIEPTGNQSGDE